VDKRPLVSVIIPTYNHAGFIREALESLCTQTFSNWEAIVVNNYSEDETISVVESFCDSRISLENFRNHGVIAASRNHAIKLAKGEYLAFLDSDDTWFPEKLECCLDELRSGADLVCHGLRTLGASPDYEFFGGPVSGATFESLLYKGNCLTPSATLVKKKVVVEVGGFSEDTEKVTSEDYHLWIKLAKAGANMTFIKDVLGLYRVHSMNQSSSVVRHLNSIFAVINDFFPSAGERSILEWMRIRRRCCIAYYGAGRELQKSGRRSDAWRYFFLAWLTWPLHLETYLAVVLNVFLILKHGT